MPSQCQVRTPYRPWPPSQRAGGFSLRNRPRKRRRLTSAERNERSKRNHGCSYKVWFAAKKRQVKFFGNHLWHVWGGENDHIVYLDKSHAVCNCQHQTDAYNQTCCHIQAVKNKLQEVLAARQ